VLSGLGFALGYLIGRANFFHMNWTQTVRQLDTYFQMIFLAGMCLLLTGLGICLALRPRPGRAMTEWHKMPWQTAIVIRLTDQGLWIFCMVMATAFAAGLLSPETVRALLSPGAGPPPMP